MLTKSMNIPIIGQTSKIVCLGTIVRIFTTWVYLVEIAPICSLPQQSQHYIEMSSKM